MPARHIFPLLFLFFALNTSTAAQERLRIELSEGQSADVRFSAPFKDVVINSDKVDVVPVTDRVLRVYAITSGQLSINIIGKSGRVSAILGVTVRPSKEYKKFHVGPEKSGGPKIVHPPVEPGQSSPMTPQ